MEILTSYQMADADGHAINTLKIPSLVLMENAGIGAADEIVKICKHSDKIIVVAGVGNNGGDGYVLARQLVNRGFFIEVLSVTPDKLKNDAEINYNILKRLSVKIFNSIIDFDFKGYDLIVDAIFGTGLNRAVEGDMLQLIKNINISGKKVVSVDIPSGLSGNCHNLIGICVKADYTITFCRPKIPHCMYPAKSFCGEVIIKDISIPDISVNAVVSEVFLLNKNNVPKLKKRLKDCHKGSFGHTVVIGGSEGKIGALAICAMATVRMGSGLTTVVTPKNYINTIHGVVPEAMCFPVSSIDKIDFNDAPVIFEFLQDKKVVAIGPGMGKDSSTGQLIKNIILKSSFKVVVDADGINFLNEEVLESLKFRGVLTPHIGEFSRLVNLTKNEVLKNRLKIAKDFAIKYSVVLVLKSSDTIIALPSGVCFVFNEGSPSLSKGGSGDCLTGIIAALLSQNFTLEDAALLGVYIHGRTGRFLAEKYTDFFPTAKDVVEKLWVTAGELY